MQRVLLYAIISCIAPAPVLAQSARTEEDDKGIFGVVIENDMFAGDDRDYTNGIRFSWISAEEQTPSWARSIARALPLATDGHTRISIAAGQNMYTPGDITLANPPTDDHPYAGWLYGSVGMLSDTGHTLDNVMLTVGVVGPWAFAKQSQRFIHKVIDSPRPMGWSHQLENEPGIILTYERKWRSLYEISPFGVGIDLTPHVGVNLGNINTDASAGLTVRVGYDLPADYGPPRIRPSLPGSDFFIPTQELGGYLFATVGEQAVARNIFLDGNTFADSPGVDKKHFVSSLQLGATLTYGETRLSYTQVFMGKEYDTQRQSPVFGVLTLSHRF